MGDAIKIDADLAAYLNVVPKTYSLSVLAALVGYLIYKVNFIVAFRRWSDSKLTLDSGSLQQIFRTSKAFPRFQAQFPSSAIYSNWAKTMPAFASAGGDNMDIPSTKSDWVILVQWS
jgi:hypothetical protein